MPDVANNNRGHLEFPIKVFYYISCHVSGGPRPGHLAEPVWEGSQVWAIPANLQDEKVLEEVGPNPHLVRGPPPRLGVVSPRMESSPPPLTRGPHVGQAQPPGWPTGQRAAGLVCWASGAWLCQPGTPRTTSSASASQPWLILSSQHLDQVRRPPLTLPLIRGVTGTPTEAHGGGFQCMASA